MASWAAVFSMLVTAVTLYNTRSYFDLLNVAYEGSREAL